MRYGMPETDPWHSIIAPLEHREFAREVVKRNPWMAAPLAAGVPLYSLLKAAGLLPKAQNTTPASMDQVFAGYEGLGMGLSDFMRK